ncbi:MAG: cryptochrome/photolyase family protein [Saprospiraceae bacterium]|nr:cryptochrome/photolyase family protein [Saprospiraceae bacterium]
MKKLRLILGDQLNIHHSWFKEKESNTLYVLMEILPETAYVRHHIQKIVGFFLAMRHFAQTLEHQNFNVKYFALDDADNTQRFEQNILSIIQKHSISEFEYQLPDEYRVDVLLKNIAQNLESQHGITTRVFDTEHFLSTRDELAHIFEGKKTYLMETFYRKMRVKYNILMEADGITPLSNRWNFDAENRQKLPKNIVVPPPQYFYRNVSDLVDVLEKMQVTTIGRIEKEHFSWCVTRDEALQLLDHFVKIRLAHFGTYQDAMTQRDTLLFHSKLSFAMNIKLISPLEVVEKCIHYWQNHQKTIHIAQIEGFVRQVIGWREYMRGVYWAQMPDYANLNFFNHQADLPSWFWTGDTQMNCLKHAIGQSLDKAYAHHIQRLMVTGAFSLLLGVHPDQVDAWYLGIYMDALEWVEITNTRGMSQYADGGIVGTKPYAGSANYVDKMSDYCQNCAYDKSLRYGHKACPFNSLYWDFYDRHRDKLSKNPRIGMMYPLLNKMPTEELERILLQADFYKKNVETL